MKALADLGPNECRYAPDDAGPADQSWGHLRLGGGGGVLVKGRMVGGGAYRHMFCGEPTPPGAVYCDACRTKHRLTRGPGKDARSLEEMIYATDQSEHRGRAPYAEHTDPMDVELRREMRKPEPEIETRKSTENRDPVFVAERNVPRRKTYVEPIKATISTRGLA